MAYQEMPPYALISTTKISLKDLNGVTMHSSRTAKDYIRIKLIKFEEEL